MKFLYGDSTPSPLKSNYLFFIRDAIELCVHLILAQDRINVLREELRATETYAEAERARIHGLRALVIEAAETANTDGAQSISKRAVDRVIDTATQSIAATLAELDAKLAADRATLAAKDRAEREGCLEAFGKYIALHQPHEGQWQLSAKLDDNGTYTGETSGRAPYGAAWKCALDLAQGHPLAKGIRVGELVTQIELSLPEPNAWQKKHPKRRPQRIDTFSVEELVTNGESTGLALRATPRGPAGIDVEFRGNEVVAFSAGARDGFDVELDDDARQRLLTLRNKLVEALTTHPSVRRRVVAALLDDAPLADADDLCNVAKRVIDDAAPTVKQIRAHGLNPHELVIRRLLDDNSRVEIFVAVAELLEKLGRVPRAKRALFEPLSLEWQRARTPLPGEIYVEPPREMSQRPVEPPTEEPRAREPDSAAPYDEVQLRDSQPLPLPTSVSQAIPIGNVLPAVSGSIDAALQSASMAAEPAPRAASPASIAIDAKDRQALAATVKRIIGVARDGGTQLAFQAYATLFEDGDFVQQSEKDQRQVLKLMVMAKTTPTRSDAVMHAYRSALARLQALAEQTKDPADHEMIGVCMRVLATLEAQ